MAGEKWVTGLTPEMPADEAARVVLSIRLSAVRHRLPLAAERAAEDVEHVHQLRVATRRAGAAVEIFRDFLPPKPRRAARSALRAVRRAAGAARDWDVFQEMLAATDAARPSGGEPVGFLAGYALRERVAAQETLAAVAAEQSGTVEDLCAALPAAVRRPGCGGAAARTLAAHGADVLGRLFAEFSAGADANPTTPEGLHRLRITGKRLRYAIEVLASCFAPPLKAVLYPAVEQVQEVLGALQDAAVADELIGRVREELRLARPATAERIGPGLAELADGIRRRSALRERTFRDWVGDWSRLTAEHPMAELMATAGR